MIPNNEDLMYIMRQTFSAMDEVAQLKILVEDLGYDLAELGSEFTFEGKHLVAGVFEALEELIVKLDYLESRTG